MVVAGVSTAALCCSRDWAGDFLFSSRRVVAVHVGLDGLAGTARLSGRGPLRVKEATAIEDRGIAPVYGTGHLTSVGCSPP